MLSTITLKIQSLGRLALLLAFASLLLAGCGSTPKRSVYYQDDGPPDRVPADIAAIPDAQPRVEPLLPYVNRPYVALGKSYTPLTDDRAFTQRGMASWYGKQFHGNKTASGERYDMMAMTAAHPTLPLPSYVRVTNVRNGRTAIVRVNDRGPFKSDRIIDLSYAAASKLGIAGPGTGEVEIERITMRDIASGNYRKSPATELAQTPAPRTPPSAVKPNGGAMVAETAIDVGAVPVPVAASALSSIDPLPPIAQSVAALPAPAASRFDGAYAVQLGAFSLQANAEAFAARAGVLLGFAEPAELPPAQRVPQIERRGDFYRVMVGAFSDRTQAAELAQTVGRLLERDVVVVQR